MAATITPTQTRYNDPYQQTLFEFNTTDSKVYISRESNKLLNVVGNDIVIKDMYMGTPTISAPSTVSVSVNTGWAIQDETLIQLTSTGTLTLDCAALSDTTSGGCHLAIFLRYQYIHTVEENLASVDIFHIQADGTVTDPLGRFDASLCRILLGIINFTKSGANVTVVSTSELTGLLVNGVTMTLRGNEASHVVLPGLFEIAFREYREYLLKRDYLLME